MEWSQLMAGDHAQRKTSEQEEQVPQNIGLGTPQGQSPFLHQRCQVERQGAPEAGAVNPGAPLKRLCRGVFEAESMLLPSGQREEH